MIRSGPMRHLLVFQSSSESSDGVGAGGTVSWSDVATVWAEKWSVKASERVEAARSKQNAIHRWHLRNNSSITPRMRIKWVDSFGATRYQEVLAVTPLGNANRELEVVAEEKS